MDLLRNIFQEFILIILILNGIHVKAQCCQCTKSGPELVINGDFSAGNSGFKSAYQYSNASQPGRYGIVSNSNDANNLYWEHCYDHTGSNGNFMWVDFSESSLNIWSQNITSISNNKYYLISCWVNTVSVEGPAIVQFSINGKSLSKPYKAPFQTCNWVKYCYLWYSGNNNSAYISINNVSKTGSGNDLGLDDISFTECQPSAYYSPNVHICEGDSYILPNGKKIFNGGTYSDTLKGFYGCDSIAATLVIVDKPYDMKVNVPLCGGAFYTLPDGKQVNKDGVYIHKLKSFYGCDSLITTTISTHDNLKDSSQLNHISCYGYNDGRINLFSLNGNGPYAYMLDGFGQNSSGVFDKLIAGTYKYIITDVNKCKVENKITLNQPEKILIRINQSKLNIDIYDSVFILVNTNYYPSFYKWSPSTFLSCDTCDQLIAYPDKNISYNLLVKTQIKGNICEEDTLISIHLNPFIYCPNSFTPNADGINDVFNIRGNYFESIIDFRIEIYNAWGEKLFETQDPFFEWDGSYEGKLLQNGVLAYCIKYKVINSEKEFIFRGTLILLR